MTNIKVYHAPIFDFLNKCVFTKFYHNKLCPHGYAVLPLRTWTIWSVLSISPEFLVLCSVVGILSVNWPRRPASYSVLFPLEKPLIWEMTFINVSSSNFSWRWFLARCGDHICSIWLPPAELGRIEASQEGWRDAQWFPRAKIRRKFFRAIC